VLRGFAFTMLVGIVSGTYSTIFIASAIAIILSQRKTPVAVASASVGGAQVGAGPRRKSKGARA
jgi:preprotein translocase subunit SecF